MLTLYITRFVIAVQRPFAYARGCATISPRVIMRRPTIAVITLLLIVLTGCNLAAIEAPTPTPFPTARPLTGSNTVPPIGGVTFVTATPFGNPAPNAPAVPTVQATGPGANAASWLIGTVILPAWNFLYAFGMQTIGTLWVFAGAQGGVIAQGLFCILPAALLLIFVVRRAIWGRRR